MSFNTSSNEMIIKKEVHCPFCETEKALLISNVNEKKLVLQSPAFGLKYLLCLFFTFGIYAFIHGLPGVEVKRTSEYNIYGFCPECGKTYNASPPEQIKNIQKPPKLYRSNKRSVFMGICGGISEYTELPVRLIRAVCLIEGVGIPAYLMYEIISVFGDFKVDMTVILPRLIPLFIPAAIYFLVALLEIMPKNPDPNK